jgi:hypothetical protein
MVETGIVKREGRLHEKDLPRNRKPVAKKMQKRSRKPSIHVSSAPDRAALRRIRPFWFAIPDTAMREHPKDPLHGITLEALLREMVERYGWDELAARIPVRCFMFDPSIKSSLTFLRKTPWARKRLEDWFVAVK